MDSVVRDQKDCRSAAAGALLAIGAMTMVGRKHGAPLKRVPNLPAEAATGFGLILTRHLVSSLG
jgi:hypothetical protein